MPRARTVFLAAVGAVALVAAVSWGTTAPRGDAAGAPTALDDSVFAAALGVTDDATGGHGPDLMRHRMGMGPRVGPGMGPGMGMGPMLGMGGWLLHGEGVVPGPDGTYLTVAVQGGKVTAVDASSVAVTSADGYSRVWALTGDTRYWSLRSQGSKADLEVGADVRVAGAVDGSTATARLVWFPPKPGTFPRPSWTKSNWTKPS